MQGQKRGREKTARGRGRKSYGVKMWHHGEERAQKHGAERRPYWRGQKSLVSLVSSTRLKGQMESQWGSLSGSHYWNRKFFFLFTYTQSQSWKQLALRDSSVFLPNEWNKSVCLHSRMPVVWLQMGYTAGVFLSRWCVLTSYPVSVSLDKILFWHRESLRKL